jgi:hypothetical protein
LKNGTHGNQYLQASYNKHGSEAFKVSLLETCEEAFRYALEQSYLDYYRRLPSGVYNKAGPVETPTRGCKFAVLTEKQKIALERTRLRNIGRKHSAETRALQRARKLGGKQTPEHVAKSAASRTGLKRSPEAVKKTADTQRGRASPAGTLASVMARATPVRRHNADGTFVDYPSIAATAADGFTKNTVRLVVLGVRKSHRGFRWSYVSEEVR